MAEIFSEFDKILKNVEILENLIRELLFKFKKLNCYYQELIKDKRTHINEQEYLLGFDSFQCRQSDGNRFTNKSFRHFKKNDR